MPPEAEVVREWLRIAGEDLRAATVDLRADPPLLADACFHCQQAIEKSLKAFLTHHKIAFMRSHDVGYLLMLCATMAPTFESWRQYAGRMTGYAVRFRYPMPGADPSEDESHNALRVACELYRFVLVQMPAEPQPGT
jgi:HEPN domain-containing protein